MRPRGIALAALALAAGLGGRGMAGTVREGRAVKSVFDLRLSGPSLLKADGWRPWEKCLEREGAPYGDQDGIVDRPPARGEHAASGAAMRWRRRASGAIMARGSK